MKRKVVILVAIAALLAAPAAYAGDETRWVNVHVTENSSNTNVEVHLPLNLVLTVLRAFLKSYGDLSICICRLMSPFLPGLMCQN